MGGKREDNFGVKFLCPFTVPDSSAAGLGSEGENLSWSFTQSSDL
jgi:hypothetical protein